MYIYTHLPLTPHPPHTQFAMATSNFSTLMEVPATMHHIQQLPIADVQRLLSSEDLRARSVRGVRWCVCL